MTVYYTDSAKEENVQISYGDHKELREKMFHFIETFVKNYPYIFGNICLRCGNCCRRENIFVTSGDLFTMGFQLGLTEKEVYERHLVPCNSWSDYDGFMKTADNKCPFLDEHISGRTTCKIYDSRPQECSLFFPCSPVCKKDTADLIEQIRSLEIEGDKFICYLKPGSSFQNLFTQDLKEKYSDIVSFITSMKPGESDKVRFIMKEVEAIIIDVEKGKFSKEEFKRNVSRIKRIVQNIWEERVIYNAELEVLWTRICNLEVSDKYTPSIEDVTDAGEEGMDIPASLMEIDNFNLKKIRFYPRGLFMDYRIGENDYINYNLYYSQIDEFVEIMRSFINNITVYIKNNFPRIMDNYFSKCYMCGACCRLVVEIEPGDMKRLADELKMTEEDFRKEYIVPGLYSWNPGSGVMKKVSKEDSGKKGCPFLTKGVPNLYYCSVHHIKPDLCHEYKPGKLNCYRSVSDDLYYRLSSNIQEITLESGTLSISTPYTYFHLNKPFVINWQTVSFIKKDIDRILEGLRDYLKKNYSFTSM